MPVDFAKRHVVVHGARDQLRNGTTGDVVGRSSALRGCRAGDAFATRQGHVGTGRNTSLSCRHGPGRREQVAASTDNVRRDRWSTAPEELSVEEEEELILHDRTTNAQPGLVTPLGRIDTVGSEAGNRGAISRVQGAIAPELISAAVIAVAARPRDGIHDTTCSFAEFGGVVE